MLSIVGLTLLFRLGVGHNIFVVHVQQSLQHRKTLTLFSQFCCLWKWPLDFFLGAGKLLFQLDLHIAGLFNARFNTISYIGESCSMNNANETRAEFNHLIAVAKDTGCAIVIIAHMNKMRDTNPLYRTNGSIDIAGAARSILAITRTPNKEAPAERYLVQVKSNLAPTGSAILFEVSEKGVDFISEMEMTAEEAFQSLVPKIGRPNDKEVKAKAFLMEMLKDGEMLSSDCEEKLEAAGFKKSTIKKAKKNAGVISRKKGFLWYWSLPMGDIPKE